METESNLGSYFLVVANGELPLFVIYEADPAYSTGQSR